jgi:hypothetical protein
MQDSAKGLEEKRACCKGRSSKFFTVEKKASTKMFQRFNSGDYTGNDIVCFVESLIKKIIIQDRRTRRE